MKRRILSLVLAVLMIVTAAALSSCKKGGNDGVKPGALTTKNLTNIYSAKELDILGTELENVRINNMYQLSGNRILLSGYDNVHYENHYFITDADASFIKQLTLSGDKDGDNSNTHIMSIVADKDTGDIWYVKSIYTRQAFDENGIAVDDMVIKPGTNVASKGDLVVYEGEGVAVLENSKDVAVSLPAEEGKYYYEFKEERFLVKLNSDGELVSETDISPMLERTDEEGNKYNYYVNNIILLGDQIVLNCGEALIFADKENCEVKNTVIPESGYYDTVFVTAKGEMYCSYWEERGTQIGKIDIATGKLEAIEFPEEMLNYVYSFTTGGLGFDIFYADTFAFYGYNMGDAHGTEICNYINSDIDTGYGRLVPAVLEDGRLVVTVRDSMTGEASLLVLTKVAPEDVKEKYVITVGAVYMDSQIKSELIKFNRTSDEYKVVFKNYDHYNNEENQWQGAEKKLAEDIMSKENAPDIVLLDTYSQIMDVSSLASKGVFYDLETFMSKDEDFNRADYLENVFEAQKINGKQYLITPMVNFTTCVGKKSVFGDKTSWTTKEFVEMHKSLGEGETMLNEPTRQNVGTTMLILAIDQFIGDDGKCSFNSDEFKSLLEYLKEIPEDYTAYEDMWNENPTYWEDMETSYSKGTTKLMETGINSFDMIPQNEAYLGGEVAYVGYPTGDINNGGAIIRANSELAVSSATKVPDGAWTVIKHLLSDKFQNQFSGLNDEGEKTGAYMFPVKKSVLEKRKQSDLMPYTWTYTDENGEEVTEEEERKTWIAGTEVDIRKSTDEDVQRVYDMILGAKTFYRPNKAVEDIIMQEAASYFDGQKSVDEVADIINSRVQLLVNERR